MNNGSVTPSAIAVFSHPREALACVRIAGDVDLTAEPALVEAAARLHAIAARTVFVDLGAVTFASSTLVTFLVRVRNATPKGSSLALCRPTPVARRILDLTALGAIATVFDDLPPDAAHPHTDGSKPRA